MAEAPTLIEYANRMGNRSLGSRLGYLLQRLGHSAEGLFRSAVPVALEPSRPRRGPLNSRWQVVVNVPEAELEALGVG